MTWRRVLPIMMQSFSVTAIMHEIIEAGTGKSMTRRKAWGKPFGIDVEDTEEADRIRAAGYKVGGPDDTDHRICWPPTRWQALKPGDLLWVTEPWQVDRRHDEYKIGQLASRRGFDPIWFPSGYLEATLSRKRSISIFQDADLDGQNSKGRLRSIMHLPKEHSRITLEVTKVRVERLTQITDQEAEMEGVIWDRDDGSWYVPGLRRDLTVVRDGDADDLRPEVRCFSKLWNHLHGKGAWERNPEVVVIGFKPMWINVNELLKEAA